MLKYLFSLPLITLVHSWYPNKCCSDNDCKPVDCSEIEKTPEGFRYYAKELGKYIEFTREQEDLSQDNNCHVCYLPSKSYCIFTKPFKGTS